MPEELAQYNNIEGFISSYNLAIENAKQAHKFIKKTDVVMVNSIGKYSDCFLGLFKGYGIPSIEKLTQIISKKYWYYICNKTIFKLSLTPQNKSKIIDDLETNKMPEITLENVKGFIEDIIIRSKDLFDDYIELVEKILRPYNHSKLVTNKNTYTGMKEKIILERYLSDSIYLSVDYHWQDNYRALENVMKHFDNKPRADYNEDIVYKTNEQLKAGKYTFELEYFDVKCFKNGNIHLKCKRKDLINKFNKYCGSKNLT